eukprot:6820133-Pyramimonas_sp.AAC.1
MNWLTESEDIRVSVALRDSRSHAQAIAYQVRQHLGHSLHASIEVDGNRAPREAALNPVRHQIRLKLKLAVHEPVWGIGSQ